MSADLQQFALGAGRPRPRYSPRSIQCGSCGGGLSVKDERAELVVCDYCGSHLELSGTELKVLGRGAEGKPDLPLSLGDSFRWEGARYEVVARMVQADEDDAYDQTLQFLLYNPRRGVLWLDEYEGHWSISWTSHVMADPAEPFHLRPGDSVNTYDGGSWTVGEVGVTVLKYVDGALPWRARIGDRVEYCEASNADGEQLAVERVAGEIEINRGRPLTSKEMTRALGRKASTVHVASGVEESAAVRKRWYIILMAAALVAAAVNGGMALYAMTRGTTVLEQAFGPAELSGEVVSRPFQVAAADNLIRVNVRAQGLDNEWMVVDFALVEGEDKVIHTGESTLEYYHGVEDGESWSEGDFSEPAYIRVPKAGTYSLLVKGGSGRGNAAEASAARHIVSVEVRDGVWMPHFFFGGAIAAGLVFGLALFGFLRWRGVFDDEDD